MSLPNVPVEPSADLMTGYAFRFMINCALHLEEVLNHEALKNRYASAVLDCRYFGVLHWAS